MWTAENRYQMIQQIFFFFWCRLCEHRYDWLFRRQWTLHVAETWIFLPLHSPLNAHYWSLELANERSVCKMFAFTIVSGKKLSWQTAKTVDDYNFFLYIMHVYFRNSKRTPSFYLLFVSFCPTKFKFIKVMFKLCWKAFAPPGKHYRIGLLFIHKKWLGRGGGGTDFCDGAKLRPGPKEESLVGVGGEVLPIYGLYRFSIYTLSDLGDLSNLIGSLSIAMFENSTKIYF